MIITGIVILFFTIPFTITIVQKYKEIAGVEKVVEYSEDDGYYNHRIKLKRKSLEEYEGQKADGVGLMIVAFWGDFCGFSLIVLGIIF